MAEDSSKVNVFFIYCSECKEHVEEIRENLDSKANVLRLRDASQNTPENTPKNAWHDNALKMIDQADVIVYVVSEHTAENENVEWELKQCINKQKHIICLKLSSEYEISRTFYYIDGFTKEKKCRGEVARNIEALYSHIDDLNPSNKPKNKEYLIEFYKSFMETTESLLGRRQTMNSFFSSANAALFTIGATVLALSEGDNVIPKMLILIAISIPGIVLNITWMNLLNSLSINHKAKLAVLSNMENEFGVSSFDDEWKLMKASGKYISTSKIEKPVPIAFAVLFSVVGFIAAVLAIATIVSHFI